MVVTCNVSVILELDFYVGETWSLVSKVNEKEIWNKNVRNLSMGFLKEEMFLCSSDGNDCFSVSYKK
jgi:hypothetical protein